MYTVYWHRYPNGNEGESMTCNYKNFDIKEKAIEFLNKKAKLIKSINWAGGYVEDSQYNTVYEIEDN